MKSTKSKNLSVRSSAAEFLIFETQSKDTSIEVRYEDKTLWLTQKMMAQLFEVEVSTLNEHLTNLYTSNELSEGATVRNFRIVQTEGSRQVSRDVKHYNLNAIIAVGFRVNSDRAIQFRRWANEVLQQFTIKGYILDKKRMENGAFLDEDYFEELLEEIREIRLSERRFYQKITDIYATSMDYDAQSPVTQKFFAGVQNKMHWAAHKHTAAEVIFQRADSAKGGK